MPLHPDYSPPGETHYYLTPREMDVKSGKGPGTHDHDAALCGNGSYHFKRTKVPSCVTCTPCRAKLGLASLPPKDPK